MTKPPDDTTPLPRPDPGKLLERILGFTIPTVLMLHLSKKLSTGIYVRIPTEREVIAAMIRGQPCPYCGRRNCPLRCAPGCQECAERREAAQTSAQEEGA